MLGFVAHEIADALRTGPRRLIDMHAHGRLAGRVRHAVVDPSNPTPQRMIEDEDAARPGRCRDQSLGFGIVEFAQLALVVEVANRTAVAKDGKPLTVERGLGCDVTDIVDGHPVASWTMFDRGMPGGGSKV